MHDYCSDAFGANVIGVGLNSFTDNGGSPIESYSISNAEFINWHMYQTDLNSFQLDFPVPDNSGTWVNSTLHSTIGADSTPNLGSFSNGGGNTTVAWDGSLASINYTVVPGKTSLSDFGADHS